MAPMPSLEHLDYREYDEVYEPAEDTFLLMDALAKVCGMSWYRGDCNSREGTLATKNAKSHWYAFDPKAPELRAHTRPPPCMLCQDAAMLRSFSPSVSLEIGAGTGVVTTCLASLMSPLCPMVKAHTHARTCTRDTRRFTRAHAHTTRAHTRARTHTHAHARVRTHPHTYAGTLCDGHQPDSREHHEKDRRRERGRELGGGAHGSSRWPVTEAQAQGRPRAFFSVSDSLTGTYHPRPAHAHAR